MVLAPASAWAAVPGGNDAKVLARTLRVEQLVVVVYQRVLASSALRPAAAAEIQPLLAQELEHVGALERALRGMGAVVPVAPAGTASAQKELNAHHVSGSLSDLRTQHDCLKLLIDVESVAEGAYFSALSKLRDPALVRTALETMGCEAQHWTWLSALQHHGDVIRAVPYPFVQGST
jgi:ferritin-like protein